MKISSAFPSKYIKAGDLPEGQRILVSIESVESENVAGNTEPDEHKPVLYFKGKNKGMVLNKTNSQIISDVYGDETDNWVGQQVFLYASETMFQGKMVPCLRVAVPKQTNGGAVQQAARKPLRTSERPVPENPVSEEQQFTDLEVPF